MPKVHRCMSELPLRNGLCLGMLARSLFCIFLTGNYCGESFKVDRSIYSRFTAFTTNASWYLCHDRDGQAFYVYGGPD